MSKYRIVHSGTGMFKVEYNPYLWRWYELSEYGDLRKGTNSFAKIKHAREHIAAVEKWVSLSVANEKNRGKVIEIYGDEELKLLISELDQEEVDRPRMWGGGAGGGGGIGAFNPVAENPVEQQPEEEPIV